MERAVTPQQTSDLFQTIGQIFNPNAAMDTINSLVFPMVEDVECKEIKPITITEDMYMQMAGVILEHIGIERECKTGGEGYFDTRKQYLNTKDGKELQWEARGCVFFRTSYEDWGVERNITSASIMFADCQTYDEEGDKTDNDFSSSELEKYIKP